MTRQFIYKIILFLLPLGIVAYPLDLLLSNYLSKTNKYEGELEVMTAIYNGQIDSDIAIYGSSRAWVHINPAIIQDSLHMTAFNFGIDAHHFWLQYLRHLEYLEHNRKPSHIILSLDVFSLEIRNDLYGMEQFLPYMLWNKNIYTYTSRYNGFHTMDYYLPLVRFIGRRTAVETAIACMEKGDSSTIPFRNRGFLGMDKTWNADFDNAKATMKEYNIKLHPPSVQLFKRFIQECKAMDIQLILVCTPEYIEGQEFVANRASVIKLYEAISVEHEVPFLDYSNDTICRNKNLFYNALHLNKTGADIFTKKLVEQLPPILQKSSFSAQ